MANYPFSTSATTYTISTGAVGATGSYGSMFTSAGANGTSWSATPSNVAIFSSITGSSALKVTGDLEVDGNIKVKDKDLFKLMEQIENRLAIITDPDPKKLEKFKSLKKAYDHYKLMEKLIGED